MWFNWMNTLSSSLSSLLNSLQFFLDFNQSRFIIEFYFWKFCNFRRADEGLQKVNQTEGPELHVSPRDITNKHIMAYGKVWTAVNRDSLLKKNVL